MLLTGRQLQLNALIPLLLETAALHRFERYGAYVHQKPNQPEQELTVFLLQSQLLLRYLSQLGILTLPQGGSLMEVETQTLPDALRGYLEELQLTPAQRALFLLGVLVGEVANAQYIAGKSKPVLEKIQFQGMDSSKIVRLANEVYEKLRQYRVASYNEGVFAAMKALLDHERHRLQSPQENVYWLLSGYAWATWQAIQRGRHPKAAEPTPDEVEA